MPDRRKFMCDVSLGSLASLSMPWMFNISPSDGDPSPETRVGGLLPVAVINDAFNLAYTFSDLHPATAIALTQNLSLKIPGNKGWLANFAIEKDEELVGLLRQLSATEMDAKALSKLSLIFGALVYTQLKGFIIPVYEQHQDNLQEMMMYHDAFTLLKIALRGKKKPSSKDMEQLLNALAPRTLTRIHTLIADTDDPEGWLHKMVTWRNQYTQEAERRASIISQPEAKKTDTYIDAHILYIDSDPAIRLARTYMQPSWVREVEVMEMLDNSMNKSIYGKALEKGVKDIFQADRLLQGRSNSLHTE